MWSSTFLLETCVEESRPGTCYRAAGRPPGSLGQVGRKSVWLRGLQEDWRSRLRREPGLFPVLELDAEAGWSEREFARSDLPDGWLRERLARMGKA